MAASASVVALAFSAYSLWETSLKTPQLRVFAAPVVHYTRDPGGNLEVFAVPLTISNHGARDGAVLSVELEARSVGSGARKSFYSAYSVDGQFFVKPASFNQATRSFERVERPKTPFAPISVAGRSAYSGTLLFYTKGKNFPKLVHEKGDYELTLRINAQFDDTLGALDRLWLKPPQPVKVTVRLGYFSESQLLRGGTHRLTDVAWQEAASGETGAEQPAKP